MIPHRQMLWKLQSINDVRLIFIPYTSSSHVLVPCKCIKIHRMQRHNAIPWTPLPQSRIQPPVCPMRHKSRGSGRRIGTDNDNRLKENRGIRLTIPSQSPAGTLKRRRGLGPVHSSFETCSANHFSLVLAA